MDVRKELDKDKAIAYLSELISFELEKPHMSEKRLGWLMKGLSQGTINKIRQGKFKNIPDYDTLNSIAVYYGKNYLEFFAELIELSPGTIDKKNRDLSTIANVYKMDSIPILAEVLTAASISIKLLASEQERKTSAQVRSAVIAATPEPRSKTSQDT